MPERHSLGGVRPRVLLLGLTLENVTLIEAVGEIAQAVEGRVRGYVVTPNVDHVVRFAREPAFREAYGEAMFALADSVPLVWGSRLLGRPLVGRVAGADLLPALCVMAAQRGFSVFLMGGGEGVAPLAAARLVERFPALRIAGTHTPPEGFGADPTWSAAAIDAVNRAKPDLLFVGLGSPKQEVWVHEHRDRLAAFVTVCCGAAIDYASGVQLRAPVWVQRVGLEWLWRLLHEPRRLWRRYLVADAAFLGIFLREWWRLRVRKFSG